VIRRMISRDLGEFRDFQTRTVEVGRIRTGQYVIPEGKSGRPVKLDKFRLTSEKEEHIRAAAEQYGGEARPYQPQGGGAQQWEVVTELGSLEVLLINGQHIDPVYEQWGKGRTCIRRCDGVWNAQTREDCLCNGPNRPSDPRQLCKITTRAQVMLPSVAGLHAWRLETHSENAAVEWSAPTVGGLVRIAQVPVPATLYLRKEQRRERNHARGEFETRDFFVPTFHIRLSALELAAGPEAITAALVANGAPAALAPAEVRRELEAAAPAQTPQAGARDKTNPEEVPPQPADPLNEGRPLEEGELPRILTAIENASTLAALDVLKDAFASQNVRHRRVFDAWLSKRAGIEARDADQLAQEAAEIAAEALQDEYANREPYDDTEPYIEGLDRGEPDYPVGTVLTVGGIEFTKISDNPFPPGSPAAQLFDMTEAAETEAAHWDANPPVEGAVEGTGLPMVPAGSYDRLTEWSNLLMAAGKLSPPMTTEQVKAWAKATYGVTSVEQVTGEKFARLRLSLAG